MRILIETSGGGGVVLLIVLALAMSHGAGISAALFAVLLALIIAVVLAVASVLGFLIYRARQSARPAPEPAAVRPVLRAEVLQHAPRAAIAPEVRLSADQLAEIAEMIRRQQAEQ